MARESSPRETELPVSRVVQQFDQIAAVYDETREPLDDATLRGLQQAIEDSGCRSLLEVGVGTGRIAQPLSERGFHVTGL